MPVIPVNRVGDKKIIIGKNGGEAQGVADAGNFVQWNMKQ
jgi:GTPase Era involved in 16S rRNA processing